MYVLLKGNDIFLKNINFLSCQGGIGEIEYDLETEEWIELSSTFLNEKTYLPLLKLLDEIKKQKFKHLISQRNCGQFIRSPPIVRKINKKITLVFHYFGSIEKNSSQLFCMGDIENINLAIDIYEKYDKNLLSTFYLLIKFSQEKKYSRREKHKNFDRKYKKRASTFTWIKKFRQEKKFFCFFDVKFFLVRNFFLT